MFGPTKPVSTEEHIKIYQSTGIDVDGRLEHIGRMLPHVEYCARRSIEFIKELPGFRSLPMDDKIALFKSKCHYIFVQYFSDHSFPLLVDRIDSSLTNEPLSHILSIAYFGLSNLRFE